MISQGGSQRDLSSPTKSLVQKGNILATCAEHLESIGETLGLIKVPFNHNVSQFLRDCKPNDGEIIVLGRLESEANSFMKFIFANKTDMASVVGVGIPKAIVTLKRDTKNVNVTKYDEHEELWDMDDHDFHIVTLHRPSIQNNSNNDIGELSAKEMAKEYGIGFNITSSGLSRSTTNKQGGEGSGHVYRLHELAKLFLWFNLQMLPWKKDDVDMENVIHKLNSNPEVTIWGLMDIFYPFSSTNNVRSDGSSASSSGGGGGGGSGGRDHENSEGEDGHGKDNHDRGNDMGGGGGGGGNGSGPTSDEEDGWTVEVHPGYDHYKNSDYAKHIEIITIQPMLTFHFRKGIMGAREIQTELFVNYGMRSKVGPGYNEDNHFAWYHNSLGISLQCMSQDAARIKPEDPNIMGVEDMKTSHNKTTTTTMIPTSTIVGGGFTLQAPSIAKAGFQMSKTFSSMPTTSTQDAWTREHPCMRLPNGFVPLWTSDGGPQPIISCEFLYPRVVPHEVLKNIEFRKECASWSICGCLQGSIKGTWQGLNKEEACPYMFRAKRSLKGLFLSDCEPKIKSKNFFKRKKIDEQQVEEKELHQIYDVELCVNHAMTHIHKLRKFSCIEQGETCHGILSIEKINGAHIGPPRVHLH